jgi:hypothetical protein
LVQKFSRIKVYNALAIPILLYGSEISTLRKRDKKRLTLRWNISEQPGNSFGPQKEWRNFRRVVSRTSWRETK